jgi:hypothetical protein
MRQEAHSFVSIATFRREAELQLWAMRSCAAVRETRDKSKVPVQITSRPSHSEAESGRKTKAAGRKIPDKVAGFSRLWKIASSPITAT